MTDYEEFERLIRRRIAYEKAEKEKERLKEKLKCKKTEDKKEEISVEYNIKDPRNFIQVPQHRIIIAREETHRGKDMYKTLESLAREGLKMPSPAEFMRHWMNVKEAAERKNKLLYADGSEVSEDDTKHLWNYMSSTDRSEFNGADCWTWLNAFFRNENNSWYIETDLKVAIDKQGNKSLKGKSQKLIDCVRMEGFVSLDFNDQGLPIKLSKKREYLQGKNIYYWNPIDGAVAGFDADSGRACMDCDWIPTFRSASLGVFASASAEVSSAAKNKV